MATDRDREIQHLLVVGAGAIGSLYATKLAAHCEVTAVARAEHANAINCDGLRVVGVETFTARIRALTAVPAVPPRTLVLLTTKVNDNHAAATALAPVLRDDTLIVCLQNGLGGEAIVKSALVAGGAPAGVTVLRGITQFGAIFKDPGVVDYKVAGHTLLEADSRTAAVAELFNAAGLDARVSDSIVTDVWRKLIFNCVINPITSITGTDVGGIADSGLDPLKRLVIAECIAVARADGVTLDGNFMDALVERFGHSRNIASMRQDLLKGKPTEIEHMNGAVAALGRARGIPCPVNAALTAIIKAMEGKIAPA
jgi:2-dehydropantoate 2-reductase